MPTDRRLDPPSILDILSYSISCRHFPNNGCSSDRCSSCNSHQRNILWTRGRRTTVGLRFAWLCHLRSSNRLFMHSYRKFELFLLFANRYTRGYDAFGSLGSSLCERNASQSTGMVVAY